MNSNRKGKEGERELANQLKEYGYGCRRGQQFCGSNGDADVVGLPGVHIECKRVEQLRPYDWMAQAERDAVRFGDGLPAVFFRRNRFPWLVVMNLEDWLALYDRQKSAESST